MNIEKEKLKLIRKYCSQIGLVNGVALFVVCFTFILVLFTLFLSRTSDKYTLFALLFSAILMLIISVIQTVNIKNPKIIVGKLLKKEEIVYHSGRSVSTVYNFEIEFSKIYEIDKKLELKESRQIVPQKVFTAHESLFYRVNEGLQGTFISTNFGLIFSTLDEIDKFDKDKLELSFKSKKIDWIIGGIILFFIFTVFLLIAIIK